MIYRVQGDGESPLLEATTVKEVIGVLKTSVTPYWETHYTFGSESIRNEKHISVTSSIGARKRGCEPNSIFPIFILFFFAAAKLHLFLNYARYKRGAAYN